MIILILIIAIICFIYFNVIPGKGHNVVSWISLIAILLSIVGIVEHDHNHWGMTTKTTTTSKQLVSSVSPKLPVLLYQPLGNGTEKIYLYKTDKFDKKPKPTKTDQTSVKVNKNAKEARVDIKNTRYVYKDSFSQFLFYGFDHDGELKNREYVFSVPKNWQVISVQDMKKLQKQMKE